MRYQIFISSTYVDLKEERQELINITLKSGNIPMSMEFFKQDDKEQWEIIKEAINSSDIFVIMVANRYGTICSETGKSYTQMEYEHALKKDKPIIRLVLQSNENELDSSVKNFREQIRKGHMVPEIQSREDLGATYRDGIEKYRGVYGGWVRAEKSEIEKYKLAQFLMFAEDDTKEGFNRFSVVPKIIMLMDMKKMFNPVSIGRLELNYTMMMSDKDKVYSCERNWKMLSVRNMSERTLDSYCLFTATDKGNQRNPNIKLMNCVDSMQFDMDQSNYRNNGIFCWRWKIKPSVEGKQLINDMQLKQEVENAWDFNIHNQEIMYFIPKCFGLHIEQVQIVIEIEEAMPQFDMKLYQIKNERGEIVRKRMGILEKGALYDGKRKYGMTLDGTNEVIDMDSVYYVLIRL